MGAGNLAVYLAKSIVFVIVGSNDYINNYLLPNLYNSSSSYNPQDYADLLLNHYTRQILVIIYHFKVNSPSRFPHESTCTCVGGSGVGGYSHERGEDMHT